MITNLHCIRFQKSSDLICIVTQAWNHASFHPTPVRSILILSSRLRLGIPSGAHHFLTFPHQNNVYISLLSRVLHVPQPFHPSWTEHPNNIRYAVQIISISSSLHTFSPSILLLFLPSYTQFTLLSQHRSALQARSENFEKWLLGWLRHIYSSVCPSVSTEQLRSHWMDLHEIWYLSIFLKSVWNIKVALKSGKNNRYFTWIPRCVYDNTGLFV